MHPRQLLNQYQIRPKKSLGQNYLVDADALSRIVSAARPTPQDQILEIGPGTGSLTRLLAERTARVVAVELDQRLIPILQDEMADYENVQLVQGDILNLNPREWFDEPFKVVANVPYYITGAILRHLLSAEFRPSMMVLTVQKEVAARITATPPKMSLLAVSVQFYGQPAIVETIKAGAFWPKPEVDSAVVRIKMHKTVPAAIEPFFRLVRAGFSQKRKQLKNNLRGLGYKKEEISRILDEVDIDGRRRAETLGLTEWLRLANRFMSSNQSSRDSKRGERIC